MGRLFNDVGSESPSSWIEDLIAANWAARNVGRLLSGAVVLVSIIYSLVRFLLAAINTSRSDRAKLRAEVLALRQQVKVLDRQIQRVRWEQVIG